MHRSLVALIALLLTLLPAAPAGSEPASGFGFGGVVEAPGAFDVVALDDGTTVLVGYDGLRGFAPDGTAAWTMLRNEYIQALATDGERAFAQIGDKVLAVDADGDLDQSFGGDGSVEMTTYSGFFVDGDGRLLVGSEGGVTRLRADGTVDATFSVPDYLVAVDERDGAFFMQRIGDGRIRRHLASGEVDTAWGDGGSVDATQHVAGLSVASDGSLVVLTVQWMPAGLSNEVHVRRWTPAGRPDPSFGLGGVAGLKVRCGVEVVHQVEVGDDGSVYVIGASSDVFESAPVFVAKLTRAGRPVGYENLGTSSPYTFIGRDVSSTMLLALQESAGRIMGLVSSSAGVVRLHALDLATSFDGPDADTGYWLVNRDGAWPRGQTSLCTPLQAERDIVGAAAGATRFGYWMVDAAGRVETAGKVAHHGQVMTRLNAPVLGITARPQGDGYWIVAGDGGIFSFGGASFHGSTGAIRLNAAIVGMASTPSGNGYWLVARDGGIFSFGDARFFGSTGAMRLNQPIVGMASTSTGGGYWLAAADGGVFTFGDAPYLGSGYDNVFGPHADWVGIMTP